MADNYEHVKNLCIRGKEVNNGSAEWIIIGRLYRDKNTLKEFITLESSYLSPSLLLQLQEVRRNTVVNLYLPQPHEIREKIAKQEKKSRSGGGFDDFDDDIPF